jgi:hypothetical protein
MATSGDEGSNLLETPSWIDKFLTQIRAAAADSSGELVVPFKPRRSLKKATLNGNNNFESLKIIDLLLKFRNISAIVKDNNKIIVRVGKETKNGDHCAQSPLCP